MVIYIQVFTYMYTISYRHAFCMANEPYIALKAYIFNASENRQPTAEGASSPWPKGSGQAEKFKLQAALTRLSRLTRSKGGKKIVVGSSKKALIASSII